MEAPAGATNLLKLETSGADLSKPLPLGYANEFTVVFSDVHNSESGRSIESKEINAGPFKWRVWLYPRGVGEGEGTHVSVFLSPIEYSHRPTWFRTSILSIRGDEPLVQDANHNMGDLQRQGWSAWGTRKFCPIATCFGPERGYYVNNKLHVRIQFLVEKGLLKRDLDMPPCAESELSKKELAAFPPFYETGLSSLLAIESSEELSPTLILERTIQADAKDTEASKLDPPKPSAFTVRLHPSVLKLAGFEDSDTCKRKPEDLISELTASPLPTRSVLGFVAVLYGATLKMSDPVTLEDIRLLCHVIHLLRIFEIDSFGLVYQLRHSLFYAPAHSIDIGSVLKLVWTECEGTQLLLDIIIPHLKMETAQFEAATISLEAHLSDRIPSFFKLSRSVFDRNYVYMGDSQSFKLTGLKETLLKIGASLKLETAESGESSCNKDTFAIRVKKRSGGNTPRGGRDEGEFWSVKVSTEILYARWPYFRRLINSGLAESSTRTATLPFSKEVLLEIVHELCSDGTAKSAKLLLSESECMDVLLDGREFELYSDLDDFKVGEVSSSDSKALKQGLFGRLIQQCVNCVFSKELSKNTLTQLERAHTLQWKARIDEIATYIGANFKSVFADQSNKKRLKELPQDLRLLILDSHIQHI